MFNKRTTQPNDGNGDQSKTCSGIEIISDPSIPQVTLSELRGLLMDCVQADNPKSEIPIEDISSTSIAGMNIHRIAFSEKLDTSSIQEVSQRLNETTIQGWIRKVGLSNIVKHVKNFFSKLKGE